jgi:hypothetical protein
MVGAVTLSSCVNANRTSFNYRSSYYLPDQKSGSWVSDQMHAYQAQQKEQIWNGNSPIGDHGPYDVVNGKSIAYPEPPATIEPTLYDRGDCDTDHKK